MATKKKAKRGKNKAKGGLFNKSSEETINPTKKFIKDISDDENDIELTEQGKSHFQTLKKQKYIDSMEPPVLLNQMFHEFDVIKLNKSSFLELEAKDIISEDVKYCFKDGDNTWVFLDDKAIMLDFGLMPELTIEYENSDILKYSPKLFNDKLYFVDDKNIFIYSLLEEKWETFSISGEITSSVLFDGDKFFLIVDFIKLISLNESFKESWSFFTEGYLLNTPIIKDDFIFLTSSDGMLYKLDNTGDIVWSFNSKSAIENSPMSFEDIIIINNMAGKLIFLSEDDKSELANLDLGFHLMREPFIKEDTLYIFNRRFLYKINLKDLKIVDIVQLETPIESISNLDNDNIYITLSDGTGIVVDSNFTNISFTDTKSIKKVIQHINYLILIDSEFKLVKVELV